MTTFQPRYRTLVSLLDDSLARNGSRPLFGTKRDGTWHWSTYGEFGDMVAKARGGLAQLGLGVGDRAAVISNNRVEWAVAAYATYGRGAAFVPMYEAQLDKEWHFILENCGAKVVFASTHAIAEKLAELKPSLPALEHIVCFDSPASDPHSFAALLADGAKNPVAAVVPEEGSIAGYIYTSGTTGNPKGVLLTHANLAYNVSAALDTFPIKPEDRSLSFLPWAHSFGQTGELHTFIGAGASMGLCEGVPYIIPNLAEVKPTILLAVPNIFNKIYDGVKKSMAGKPALIQRLFKSGIELSGKVRKGESLGLGEKLVLLAAQKVVFSKVVQRFGGNLKYSISGGAALSKEVAEFIDSLGIMVFEGYGLTETSPVATVNTPDARRIGSIGKEIPGVRVVLDHEASGSADEGEILIYGHNVMKGYYNLPEESAKVFTADGGFRTGDLGKRDADGFLYVTGRIKELYKLENGKYVAPAALESKLQLSPYILQAMVYGANRAYNTAVIVPNFPNLVDWAKAQGLDASDNAALVKRPEVLELLRKEIETQGAGFKGFETIKSFTVATDEFTVQNDLLTPKLSMKRRNVLKRYEGDLEALYSGAKGQRAA